MTCSNCDSLSAGLETLGCGRVALTGLNVVTGLTVVDDGRVLTPTEAGDIRVGSLVEG